MENKNSNGTAVREVLTSRLPNSVDSDGFDEGDISVCARAPDAIMTTNISTKIFLLIDIILECDKRRIVGQNSVNTFVLQKRKNELALIERPYKRPAPFRTEK